MNSWGVGWVPDKDIRGPTLPPSPKGYGGQVASGAAMRSAVNGYDKIFYDLVHKHTPSAGDNSFRLSLLFVLEAQVNHPYLTIRALPSKYRAQRHEPPVVVTRTDSSQYCLSADNL